MTKGGIIVAAIAGASLPGGPIAQETGAGLAFWVVVIALLQLVTIILGLFVIKKAVGDTGKAIAAMRDANALAEQSARRQLRAYLVIEPGGVNEVVDGFARLPLQVENKGQSPAFDVRLFANHAVVENPRDISLDDLGVPLGGESDGASLGPGVCRSIYSYASEALIEPYAYDIVRKRRAIIQFGYVGYRDAFGDEWRTNFAFYHWGNNLTPANALRCRFGNDAT